MTKTIAEAEGKLFVDVRITTGRHQRIITGSAYSNNVKRDFKDMMQSAILNAVFKYYYGLEEDGKTTNINREEFIPEDKEGIGRYESGTITDMNLNPILIIERLNYDIEYEDYINVKRINKNGKYYTQVSLKKDNKIIPITEHRWTYKKFTEDYYINNEELQQMQKNQSQKTKKKRPDISKRRHRKPKI